MDGGSRQRLAPRAGGGARSAAALDSAPLPLRPRGVGELLDAAVELLRERFGVHLVLAALILAPARVANYYVLDAGVLDGELTVRGVLTFFGLTIGLPLLVQNLVTAVVILIVHAQLLGRGRGAGEALAGALRRLPALLALLFLMGLVFFGGVLLPVVAAVLCFPLAPLVVFALVVLGWKLYLATPALMLEGLGPLAAIRRSARLQTGGPWRWLGVFLLSWTLAVFFSGLAQFADDPALRAPVLETLGLTRRAFDPLYLVLSTLLNAIGVSFTAVVATTFYVDARMRREAFDLELRLERLAGAAPAA